MQSKLIEENIVEKLQEIRRRPLLYTSNDIKELKALLNGFNAACRIFGFYYKVDDYVLAGKERGWSWLPAAGFEPSMREKNMNSLDIISELLYLEIEAWKITYGIK